MTFPAFPSLLRRGVLAISLSLCLNTIVLAQQENEWRITDRGVPRTFTLTTDEVLVEELGGAAGNLKKRLETELPGSVVYEGSEGRVYLKLGPAMTRQTGGERRGVVQRVAPGAAVSPVLYQKAGGAKAQNRRVASRKVLLKVPAGQSAQELATSVAATVTPTALEDYVLLEFSDPYQALNGAAQLRTRGLSAEPQLRHENQRRSLPNDPYFGEQWHLRNVGQGSGTAGVDANVLRAWEITKGAGVNIAIIDDCLEILHPDLAPNAYPLSSGYHHDFNDDDSNPTPGFGDAHGTSVGGVAAAKGNNALGGSGSAPEASLIGLRLISGPVSDAEEASALYWRPAVTVGTSNNSWGPYDGGGLAGPDILARNALRQAATLGRNGLGLVTVFAAGNGLQYDDNANLDGYANSRYVLAVAALTNQAQQAYYSEPGANILVTAPSNGGTLGIFTTDVTASGGYNPGAGEPSDVNYTNSFGGTSSAAPLVTGGVALLLAANPTLGWRDVHEILTSTAVRVRPGDADWKVNGGGFKFNHKFGGGMIDLTAAVVRALDWTNLTAEGSQSKTLSVPTPLAIKDNDTTGLSRTFDFSGGPNLRVEHVEVELDIRHAHRSDLEITLTSPSGMVSTLAANRPRPNIDFTGDDDTDYTSGDGGWIFSSTHHWGENSTGTWTVKIRDRRATTTGTLNAAAVRLFGTAAPLQRFTFQTAAYTVPETASNVVVRITRLGGTTGAASVNFVISPRSTATAGADFTDVSGQVDFVDGQQTADVTIPLLNDTAAEGPEYIYVLLKSPSGAALGGTHLATIKIDDDEGNAISVLATDLTAAEKASGQAADPGEFTIQRAAPATDSVTISYSISGKAKNGTDYTTIASSATIPAFNTEVKIPINVIDDAIGEGAETVTLTLLDSPFYTVGTPNTATVIIRDNDLPTVQIGVSPGSISEGSKAPVTFTLTRTGGVENPLIVNLAIGGTARPAINYTPTMPTRVEIPSGASSATVQVSPVDNLFSEGTLNLSASIVPTLGETGDATADYRLGFNTLSRVAFLDNDPLSDTNPPTVQILTPVGGARIDVGQPVVATGKALDNDGVNRVIYRVNDGAWQVATGQKNWTADLTLDGLRPGPNLLRVRSEDDYGNHSPLASRTFYYVSPQTLNVSVNGSGSVSTGFLPTSTRDAGVTYEITATPAAGFAFDGWSGDLPSTSRVYSFVMPDQTTSLVANFVATPFVGGSSSITGTYTGLVQSANFAYANSGHLTLTLTSTGAFTATLSLGSKDFSLKGEFTASGEYRGTFPGQGGLPMTLALNLDVKAGASEQIVGTLSSSTFDAPAVITTNRKVYNADTNPYLTGSTNPAVYHIVFPSGSATNPYEPHGPGYGTLSVNSGGKATWKGKLGDGTPVLGSAPISKGGVVPLYLRLYDGGGVILGPVNVNEAQPDHDVLGHLDWFKPKRKFNLAFPRGFAVSGATLYGSRYQAPAAGVRALTGFADATDNGTVTLSDGQINVPIVKDVTFTSNNLVKIVTRGADQLRFTVDPLTGSFSGSFVHPTMRSVVPFAGVLLQREQQAVGFFLGTSRDGSNPQTGPVVLKPKP